MYIAPLPAPQKKKRSRQPKKAKVDATTSPLSEVTPSEPTQILPLSKPGPIVDVKEFALEMFDDLVAPKIFGMTLARTTIKRAIIRRILKEYISKELTCGPPLTNGESVYHFIIKALDILGIDYH